MAVTVGYKRTEVGVIPNDWEVRRFTEHFTIYAGGDVPKHSLSQTKSDAHPFPIFANALQNGGLYGYTGERRSCADSLTITARGYLGHAEYRSEPFFPIVRLLVLEPTGELDARFTAYAVNELVDFAIESTGVPQLTAPQVGKYAVGAPATLAEQKAIAAALSDVDALLGALDRLIAKKRDLKQAAMQQLLTGQTRLPGFSGKWEATMLGALGSWFSGGTPSKANEAYWSGDIPWVSPKDMKVARLFDAIDHVGQTAIGNGTRLLPPGAILIVVRGMILAHSAPVARVERPVAFNQDIKGLVVRPEIDSNFVLWWLVANETLLLSLTNEATHGTKRIPTDELLKLKLRVPGLDEQREVARVVTDLDDEVFALERRREKTRLLKQGMMQELLTGRTRLV